jgi:predicted Zn finger-like uncharacterized protein
MAIRFRCPHCGHPYRVADESGGRQVRCKACKQRIIIPEALPALDPEAEPQAPAAGDRPAPRELTPALGDAETIEQISAHIEQHVGKIATVYHELISDLVHIDIHLVEPTREQPFHTLITSGMSDLPMHPPEGAEDCRFAELLLCLPPDWPLSREAFEDERNYWPIRWLKMLARFPHEYDTWLWFGHSVPNGDPPQPFAANTALCCQLLLAPVLVPEEFLVLPLSEEKSICFFSVVPLYREEMDFKLKHGTDALVERFERHQVTEMLDPTRQNVCKKKRWPF